jgi:hypothetical protein
MKTNNELPKEDQNHPGIIEAPNLLSTEIRFGPPSGPRRPRDEEYDGHKPLEYPGHEAVAEYLATPKSFREFKSDSDLAWLIHQKLNSYRRKAITNVGRVWVLVDDPHTDMQVAFLTSRTVF